MNLADKTTPVKGTDGAVIVEIKQARPALLTAENVQAHTGLTPRQARAFLMKSGLPYAQLSGGVWAVETDAFLAAIRATAKPRTRRTVAVDLDDADAALEAAGVKIARGAR